MKKQILENFDMTRSAGKMKLFKTCNSQNTFEMTRSVCKKLMPSVDQRPTEGHSLHLEAPCLECLGGGSLRVVDYRLLQRAE
ncbi:hypothetical protein Tco_0688223 [Tanacetum coccineum]